MRYYFMETAKAILSSAFPRFVAAVYDSDDDSDSEKVIIVCKVTGELVKVND